MSEKAFEKRILAMFNGRDDCIATRNRDLYDIGRPDLTFTIGGLSPHALTGYIELKVITPPKRAATVVLLDQKKHGWTPIQRLWMTRHGLNDAACFLMVQGGDHVLLFWWSNALEVFSPPGRSFGAVCVAADVWWDQTSNPLQARGLITALETLSAEYV